jgi:hypothetical protein
MSSDLRQKSLAHHSPPARERILVGRVVRRAQPDRGVMVTKKSREIGSIVADTSGIPAKSFSRSSRRYR